MALNGPHEYQMLIVTLILEVGRHFVGTVLECWLCSVILDSVDGGRTETKEQIGAGLT